jgi:hypothetical protein
MAVTDEAGVAEQRMRARGKLIQEGVDALPQRVPVVGQAVEREHVLTQPAPDLLAGIAPGGGGRQPDQLQARPAGQGRLHVVMVVDGPMVVDDVDPLGPRLHVIQLPRAGANLLAADQGVVPGVPPASPRVARANAALLASGRAGASRPRGGVRGGAASIPSGAASGQRESPISSTNTSATASGARAAARRPRSRRATVGRESGSGRYRGSRAVRRPSRERCSTRQTPLRR